uniref:Condensin complex subunit 1 C-terminal domain-containing protein n=1 Tax=Rhipicephalus pulchellus TaxID=72859 RepID=L7M713_RHIPC
MDLDDTDSLVSWTLAVFGELPFDLLEETWVNAAWENRYTDISLPDIDLLEAVEGNSHALLDSLSTACDVCQKWSCFSDPDVDVGEEDSSDDKLWRTLMDNGVHYKALLGLVYVGIGQGNSSGATLVKKKIALRFSKLYFNLVLVPGSSAYRIFQESLFQSAIQCFRLPSKNTNLNGDGGGARNSSQSGSARGGGRGRRKQSATPVDDADANESTTVESETISESMLLDFMTCMTDSLKDLVWSLQTFSLRSYGEVIDFLIQHMCELVQLDIPGADVRFNVGLEQQYRGCHYRQLTSYAYCALKILCLPQHGEPADNFRTIAKSLMPHLLMLAAGNAQTVTRPFANIRDNAVAFICHVMQTCDDTLKDSFQDVAIILIHNVAFHAVDRTDFRLKTTHAVLMIMGELTEERFKRVVQWFIKLTTVPLANRRIFALEMILALIWDERVVDKRSDLLLAAMKRCNDKAATVKTKALSVLASVTNEQPDLWTPLLKVSNPVEPGNEGEGEQVAVEDDRLSQLMEMLKYRAEDSKVNVRKAALSLLQNVLCASGDFIKEEYVEILKESCLDLTLLVRKQALHALTKCLRAHPEEELLLRLWMEGALPLVLDAENTVMEKAVEAVEELILGPLCLLAAGPDASLAWRLLAQVSQGPFREHHKYLQQAVLQLNRAEKLRSNQLNVLKTYVGGPNDASVWLLLSKLSLCCDLGQGNFAFSYWKQQWEEQPEGSNNMRASNETVNHVLIVLKKVSRHLPSNALRELIADLEQRLSQLSLPVEVIANTVDCLHSLKRNVHRERPELGERAVQMWCKQMLDKCQTYLSEAVMGAKGEDSIHMEEQLVRHLVLLGEAAQPAPRAVSSQLHELVQACMTSSSGPEPMSEPVSREDAAMSEPDAEKNEIKEKKPARRSRARLPGGGKSCLRATRRVRAHAVVVMGTLCIQNEMLAKTVVPTMGNSLASSQDPMMRANLIVALTDMCKRYAVLVDPYLPVVTRCIKDSVPAIRSLVMTCLLQLLQQDFVKLHGRLFYRLLSALTDEDRGIRELAEFGLVDCVLKRNTHVFYHRFVECLCYFNSYRGCSGQASQENVVETTERDRRLFSLEGEGRREQRMALYRFMLLNMPDEDRFKLTLALTQSVLVPCADETNTGPGMEEECPELLHDTLWVLCSEEIKLQTIAAAAEDAATEEDPAQALLHTTRKTILSTVVRVNLVENVIPVVIALKNKLEAARSPLLRSLLMFLRELMRDYKAEVKDMLSADKKLASEVAFDLRRLEREEEEEAAAEGHPTATPKTPARAANPELRELLDTARKLREEAIKRRSIVVLPEVASEEGNAQQQNGNGEAVTEVVTESSAATENSTENNPPESTAAATGNGVENNPPEEAAADKSASKRTPGSTRTNSRASSLASLKSSKGGSKATPTGRPKNSSHSISTVSATSESSCDVTPLRGANKSARKGLAMDLANCEVEEQAKGDVPMEDVAPDSPLSRCSSLSDLSDISALSNEDATGGTKKRGRKSRQTRASPSEVRTSGRLRSPRRRFPIELGETDSLQSSPPQDVAPRAIDSPLHSDTDDGEFKKPAKTVQSAKKLVRSLSSPSGTRSTSTPVLGDRRKRLCKSPDISVIK